MSRIQLPGEAAIYHVVSRTAQQQFYFHDLERETFRRMLRRTAKFCGIEIYTHVILSNHFHLLIKVPHKAEADEALTWTEFLDRFQTYYGAERGRELLALLKQCKCRESREKFQEQVIAQHLPRMHQLPMFIKLLKQRFAKWYNKTHRTSGTLWDERYRSVVVEESSHGPSNALLAVAAYIDLNPVRAGLVSDPKDYRYSGYGEAAGGQAQARQGLQRVAGPTVSTWAAAQAEYRKFLYQAGQVPVVKGGRTQGRISPDQAKEVEQKGGKLTLAEALHRRVRYFTRGGIIGSKAYIERIFQAWRDQFSPKRKAGAKKMTSSVDWGEMRSFRDVAG